MICTLRLLCIPNPPPPAPYSFVLQSPLTTHQNPTREHPQSASVLAGDAFLLKDLAQDGLRNPPPLPPRPRRPASWPLRPALPARRSHFGWFGACLGCSPVRGLRFHPVRLAEESKRVERGVWFSSVVGRRVGKEGAPGFACSPPFSPTHLPSPLRLSINPRHHLLNQLHCLNIRSFDPVRPNSIISKVQTNPR